MLLMATIIINQGAIKTALSLSPFTDALTLAAEKFLVYLYKARTIASKLKLDKGSETGVMALMHSFLRQHHGNMDPVKTVMYGPSTSNQVCALFYVMQCFSFTKVLEL